MIIGLYLNQIGVYYSSRIVNPFKNVRDYRCPTLPFFILFITDKKAKKEGAASQ